jgi:hypothetical protein
MRTGCPRPDFSGQDAMTTIRCLTYAFALALPIFSAGCGKPAMVPVQGKITYRGHALNNGVIVFTPEQKGPLAIGLIRNDGSFVLSTGDHPGAYPGSYKVTVSSLASAASENGGRFDFPGSAIPIQYREHDPARERIVVAANKSFSFELDLP